jgi:arginyl-tRNA synthetase
MKEIETIKQSALEELKKAVKVFIEKKNIPFEELKVRIEYSRNEKFGDYSSPFLMENKDILGDPKSNSESFLEAFDRDKFSDLNFSMPGFINFKLKDSVLQDFLQKKIFSETDIFVKSDSSEKIIFEYVSANPTGPLNIVSARAAATGDTICNLLETMGHSVHREFYVNDFGNQVFLLGVSCLMRLRENYLALQMSFQEEENSMPIEELLEKNILPREAYRGEYIRDIAIASYENPERKIRIDSLLQNKNYIELSNLFSNWAVEYNVSEQKKDLKNFGSDYNLFYSEKTLHDSGKVLEVLQNLKSDIIVEEGKTIFLSTKYGDDKDRVIVRDDGRPTYLLADIAYHKTKIDRGFDKIINIWGPDHHGYISRLRGSMITLGFKIENFQILIAQQVNLISGGEKQKMGKRIGKFQTMNDLGNFLGENFRDVARYFFVMRSLDSPLDFDLDLAKEESEKNPVYYLQYAHARIFSIFREVGFDIQFDSFQKLPMNETRRSLLFWIARFPEEVFDAAKMMEPHRLTVYLQNLSKSFTKFYSNKENRLKDCDLETRLGLATLCKATAICLSSGLKLLGISAPEKMEKT